MYLYTIIFVCNLKQTYLKIKLVVLSICKKIIEHIYYKLPESFLQYNRNKNHLFL